MSTWIPEVPHGRDYRKRQREHETGDVTGPRLIGQGGGDRTDEADGDGADQEADGDHTLKIEPVGESGAEQCTEDCAAVEHEQQRQRGALPHDRLHQGGRRRGQALTNRSIALMAGGLVRMEL